MAVKKRSVSEPTDTGKVDVYRDLEERVLKDTPAESVGSNGQPGQSIIEGALTARDTHLLRAIAAERKGLTDKQRQALLLVADILDHMAKKRDGRA